MTQKPDGFTQSGKEGDLKPEQDLILCPTVEAMQSSKQCSGSVWLHISGVKDDQIQRRSLASSGKLGFGPALPWDFSGFTDQAFGVLIACKGDEK